MEDSHIKLSAEPELTVLPYWRLSGFYFFYFSVVGALVPFLGLYLHHLGFTAKEIGTATAILMITRVVSPLLWSWMADHFGRRLLIIRLGGGCACLMFGVMFFRSDFWGVAFSIALYSFFWNAILPQFEALTLRFLDGKTHQYSRIRLWGSIGFIGAVVGLGWLFDTFSIGLFPFCILSLLLLIWLSSFTLSEQISLPAHAASTSIAQTLKHPPVIAFLLVSFLLQMSHGAYYTFFTIYMEGLGYKRSIIGMFWALGVIAEIVMFLAMPRLLLVWKLPPLLVCALLLTALRWFLTAEFAYSPVIMFFVQCLHALSFGAVHAVSMELIRGWFGSRYQGQGQAVYSAFSFGAGGAVGAYFSGIIWQFDSAAVFTVSAVVAVVAAGIAWLGIKTETLRINH